MDIFMGRMELIIYSACPTKIVHFHTSLKKWIYFTIHYKFYDYKYNSNRAK